MARVLIVDDNPVVRRKLGNILVTAGHEVVGEAANAKAAFELYQRKLPDLVTMDINMPDYDGFEGIKQIIKKHPHAKIVIISTTADGNTVLDAINLGAMQYIIKPFESKKVISIINQVLA